LPKRDGHIPSDDQLDQLAEITEADVDDAVKTIKQRVPASASFLDATRNDRAGGAKGPIADEQ
jgi:hypothetical protein